MTSWKNVLTLDTGRVVRGGSPAAIADAIRRGADLRIHTDFQRGFIKAEVIHWDELLEIGSWTKAKELGKIRIEGKDYHPEDGDVMEFRFNV